MHRDLFGLNKQKNYLEKDWRDFKKSMDIGSTKLTKVKFKNCTNIKKLVVKLNLYQFVIDDLKYEGKLNMANTIRANNDSHKILCLFILFFTKIKIK